MTVIEFKFDGKIVHVVVEINQFTKSGDGRFFV